MARLSFFNRNKLSEVQHSHTVQSENVYPSMIQAPYILGQMYGIVYVLYFGLVSHPFAQNLDTNSDVQNLFLMQNSNLVRVGLLIQELG